MNPLVVLNLGAGNCQVGLNNVVVRLWLEDSQVPLQYGGTLPVAERLVKLYQRWQSLYEALNNPFGYRMSAASTIEFETDALTNISRAEFRKLCEQLKEEIDHWLNSAGFRNIDQQLRTQLVPNESIRVIIETEDPLLQKLPWHLWQFFEHYPKAEMALSAQDYERSHALPVRTVGPMRILVVLGHSEGINTQLDRLMIEDADAETVVLKEPKRAELDRYLWDEKGWDILFFAGHSTSQAVDIGGKLRGQLFLNPDEQLSVDQLRHALKASINRGLKLAIFNSCDGMEIARDLTALNFPQMIVMREPVVDPVAHHFLQSFLQIFSRGEPFYTAVRSAREKLQGLDSQYPGASWLPVIFQNPTEVPITWAKTSEPLHRPPLSVVGQRRPVVPPPPAPPIPRPSIVNLRHLLITSVAVTLSIVGVRTLGLLQGPELRNYDHLVRSRPVNWEQPQIDQRLLMVEIGQDDTDNYGYPIRDATLAEVLERLQQGQPRAIGVDMHRYQVNAPGRSDLLEQFEKSPNIVTVCSFDQDDREILGHPPEFSSEQAQQQVGFSDLETDDRFHPGRSIVRRHLLSYDPHLGPVSSDCSTPYSLSLNLALRYLRAEGGQTLNSNAEQNWQLGPVTFNRLAKRTVGYQQLDGQSSQILLNYRFTPQPAQRISLTDLLEGQIDDGIIRDRIVLIGVTDPIGNDYRDTPYGELPGVWIHAHGISQVLGAVLDDRPLISALPQLGQWQWGDMLWILGWAMVGGLLVWRVRSVIVVVGVGVVIILGLRQICLVMLVQGVWVPFVPALLALVGTVGILLAYKYGYVRIMTEPLVNRLAWKRSELRGS